MYTRLPFLLLATVVILPAQGAFAQQIPFPTPEEIPESTQDRPVETQTLSPQGPARPGTAFLIDRTVNRDEYIVGPNDQLSIGIMGYTDAFYQLEVSSDGALLVPKVGNVPLAGLTLNQAEGRLRSRAQRVFPAAEVDLALSRPRVFKVYLLGDVPDPGPKAASPLTRVSELMPKRDPETEARQIRNVFLIRSVGDTLSVDLARFRQTGDLRFNPTVHEGDIVLVPGLDETVRIFGRVFFPGTYEYRSGESLAEILRVANGYRAFPTNAHDVIQLSRFVGRSERRFHTFTRAEAMGERGEEFVLQPFDAIYVPSVSDYKVQRTADIDGEVLYPGTYPIRPDTTSVRELVQMAGGLTPEASLIAARLVRSEIGVTEESLRTLQQVPEEFLTEDERRILRVRQTSDPTNVVIDFVTLFALGKDVTNVTLKEGDRLVVPEEREGITVLGAVLEPGIVTFEPNATIDAYVAKTGGYTERADEGDVVVLKAKLQTRLERDEVKTLHPGDTIVVPFEEERDWLEIYRTTSTIATSVLSLVLTFMAAIN